jgi:hypothetical protein
MPAYWITSSAVANSVSGMVRPWDLGGLEVDDELELGRKLDRQICQLFAAQDAVDMARRVLHRVDGIATVGTGET